MKRGGYSVDGADTHNIILYANFLPERKEGKVFVELMELYNTV